MTVVVDVTRIGNFRRTLDSENRVRHYWHGVRVPWLVWAMFS